MVCQMLQSFQNFRSPLTIQIYNTETSRYIALLCHILVMLMECFAPFLQLKATAAFENVCNTL